MASLLEQQHLLLKGRVQPEATHTTHNAREVRQSPAYRKGVAPALKDRVPAPDSR